jgi:hypothetical protein
MFNYYDKVNKCLLFIDGGSDIIIKEFSQKQLYDYMSI